MKKVVKKNQIIVTALAIMIVVAGYLNFTGQKISTSGLVSNQNKENEIQNNGKEDESSLNTQKEDEKTVATSVDNKKKTEKKSAKNEKATTDISAQDNGGDDYKVNDNGEVVASEEDPGKAVMVSNNLKSEYFSAAKLSREQNRAKNKETLLEIINNKSISSKDKKAAVAQVAKITGNAEKENAAEMMLQAKGFSDSVVSISEGNADVVVNAEKLSSQQMAQIEDIVKRKSGIASQNIVITPVKVKQK